MSDEKRRVVELNVMMPIDGQYMHAHVAVEGEFVASYDPDHGLAVNETASEEHRRVALHALDHVAAELAGAVEGVNVIRGALWRALRPVAAERPDPEALAELFPQKAAAA